MTDATQFSKDRFSFPIVRVHAGGAVFSQQRLNGGLKCLDMPMLSLTPQNL